MKVLIVDDNDLRIGQIVNHLVANGVSRDSIEDRRTAHQARAALRNERFDLLLLDLLLPNRVEDAPTIDASLALLAELTERDTLIKPRKVVGLTAYSEAAQSADGKFTNGTWTIIQTSELSDEWLVAISNCVRYLELEGQQRPAPCYDLDLLIVTALADPEMSAVERLDWNWQPREPWDDITFIRRGTASTAAGDIRVVAATAERMGMVSTAAMTTKLILGLRPRLCIMPGICAGIRTRAELGDVIFAESAWDYQSGKISTGTGSVTRFEMSPHQVSVDPVLVGKIDDLIADHTLLSAVRRGWPNPPPHELKLIRAPVATGSAVLADSNTANQVIVQNRKVRGVEMELYGMYLSSNQAPAPRPLFFGIKSVCDFADATKNDDYQAYAAYTSAQVMRVFVERYFATL